MRLHLTIASLALALLLLSAGSASAASLQPLGNFEEPIYVSSDPGNPDRLFVVERRGRIQQLQGGSVSTFADIRAAVGCAAAGCAGERGLLSIALAPDFDSSGRLYVDYANGSDGTIHIAELRAGGGTAAAATLRDVLMIPHAEDDNHNGGQLQFGPDGYLYVSVGDGGGKDDEHENAQNLGTLLGKILRIDPRQSGFQPYTVPAGNPFAASPAPASTIWSYGLRNPFRFSFDRLSGDLTIGDVGQGASEEVDYAPAPGLGGGGDYGWNCREGSLPGPASDPECATPPASGFAAPLFEYPHADPGGGAAHGCAIIGGYVVRDRSLAGLYGRYLYGDLCIGQIRSFDLANPFGSDRSENLQVDALNSFGEDACGRLYAVSGDGGVFRLTSSAPAICATPPDPGQGQEKLAPSYLGIKASSRQVPRGDKALITAWLSPCKGRRGEPVKLWHGRQRLGTRHLDRVCSVRFRPRIHRRADFRATIREDDAYLPAQSRRLTIRVRRVHSKHG
jgi:hypothetical protein